MICWVRPGEPGWDTLSLEMASAAPVLQVISSWVLERTVQSTPSTVTLTSERVVPFRPQPEIVRV